MTRDPCLIGARDSAGSPVRVGHPVLDHYLEFVEARARHNTLLATASDLRVFFSVVAKEPAEVTSADVLAFITEQRAARGDGKVIRLSDGESGLSTRTIKRRLSSVSGLYSYLVTRGDAGVAANPVPRGLATRRARRRGGWGLPLVRAPHTLPRILDPDEVNVLVAALRTYRDRAMVDAMLLGGLRRCEVLGLRLEDLKIAERRVFVAEGKGGHQRMVPISQRFFANVAAYLDFERPRRIATERLFVALKGPRRGRPLSDDGIDEIIRGAKRRAALSHVSCHELRHTCLTRLREAGMALEAVQAQAGHRSLESTRIYLHLANEWLADEYRRACELIELDLVADSEVGA
jgi:site-specific recombinase XerD